MKVCRRHRFNLLFLFWMLYFLSETYRNAPAGVIFYHRINNSERSITSATSSKRQLIIHVGPPKTATTTIQEMLSMKEWQDLLLEDGFVYTGAFYKEDVNGKPYKRPHELHKTLKNNACHQEMRKIRTRYNLEPEIDPISRERLMSAVRNALKNVDCVTSILQSLESYKTSGKSLIISDETIKVRLWDWLALHALLRDEWDITVIVGYRRFVQWLPSAKQQVERWKPMKNRSNKWLEEGGNKIEPLFPSYWRSIVQSPENMPYRFTDWVINSIKVQVAENIKVKTMNMHSGASIRTTFLCETLPMNTFRNACEASHKKDVQETLHGERRIANPTQSNAYDQLTMEADAAGLIPKPRGKQPLRRRAVTLAVQSYHETVLNGTLRDFPIVCPNRKDLISFLKQSIDLERQIIPEFHETDRGERQHRKDFWRDVDRKIYCDIDTTKILCDPKWINFFKQQ